MQDIRTIKAVLDQETGEEILATNFFEQPEAVIFKYRRELEEAYISGLRSRFICYYCKQRIKIRGGSNQILHFAHLRNSDNCPFKTGSHFTEEETRCIKYNGAKESQLHLDTKEAIAQFLRLNEANGLGVSEVVVDTIYKDEAISKRWRKPDVRCHYRDKRIVFEIQLSTTFLSVIAGRERFYKEHNIFMLWIFKGFDIQPELQRFAEKDIYYGNCCNVFVLDEHAIQLSNTEGDLWLHCFYQEHYMEDGVIQSAWRNQYICLDDVTFRTTDMSAFFFDSDAQKMQLEANLAAAQQKALQQLAKKEFRNEQRIENEKEADQKRNRQHNELRSELLRINSPFLLLLFEDVSYNCQEIFDYYQHRTPLSTEEKMQMRELFERGAGNLDNLPCKELADRIASAVFIKRGLSAHLTQLPWGVMKILEVILSLKKNKVIGSRKKSVLMFLHGFLDKRNQYLGIILWAMDKYNMTSVIKEQDKTGKFFAKLKEMNVTPSNQRVPNLPWIKANFPELF